jgi:hypothetical protein
MIVAQAARRSLTIATGDSHLEQGALTPVINTRAPIPPSSQQRTS